MGILHRMIFFELLRIFVLCWCSLTALILMAGLFAEATQQGLSPGQIIKVIPFLLPNTMPYTLPTTTLFATCVVYGRLAHDNEILAIRAAGINLMQVTLPALFLGAVVSAGTFVLYLDVIPSTHFNLRTMFLKNIEELLYNMLRKDGYIKHPRINYTIYVKRVEGRRLLEAQFMRRDKTGQFDIVARAHEAELKVDMYRNQILVHMRKCEVCGEGNQGQFDDQTWPIDIPPDFKDPVKSRPTDMTWPEIFEFYDRMAANKADLLAKIKFNKEMIDKGGAPPDAALNITHLQNQYRANTQSQHACIAELHLRPAFSLGCLCFVMVGCPVGIWLSKSDYLSSFITCFLPIVVVYYPLMLCGIKMAQSGKVSPFLAIWPANLLLMTTALIMFRKLLRN